MLLTAAVTSMRISVALPTAAGATVLFGAIRGATGDLCPCQLIIRGSIL